MNFATQYSGQTIIPQVILPEVSFLFYRDFGYSGVQNFYGNFKRANAHLESIEKGDLERVHEISVLYSSAEFDFVDCCIMALSERLNIRQICTYDRRDFSIFRPKHCDYLELFP